MMVKVCLDRQRLREKPDKETREGVKLIKMISHRISSEVVDRGISRLAKLIGEDGQTFTPVVFTNRERKKETFSQMQLFVLDFDTGVPYAEMKAYAESLELPVAFSYYTFSSTEQHPKYRMVFMHGGVIYDANIADMMIAMLKALFPLSDKACFETSRMFFGGKGLIEVNEDAYFTLDRLAYHYQRYLYAKCDNQYMRNIKNFARKYQIDLLEKGILNIRTCELGDDGVETAAESEAEKNVEKFPNYIYIIIEIGKKSTIIEIVQQSKEQNLPHNHQNNRCDLKGVELSKIREKCRLFDDFYNGQDLEHNLRFLLATSLIHVEEMKKVFINIIEKYYGKSDKWRYDLRYISGMKYHPMTCDGNCPYAEACTHESNLLLTLRGYKQITKLGEEDFVSVDEAYGYLETALSDACQSQSHDIHIIKAQTGLGKTKAYIDALDRSNQLTIVAVPTVQLKNEVYDRIADKNKTLLSLSREELMLPPDRENKVIELYDRGLHREVKDYLTAYVEGMDNEGKKIQIEEFLNQNLLLRKKENNFVMTHARLLTLSEEELSGYTVIVDEDIMMSILKNMISISIADIKKAINSGLIDGEKKTELEKLLSMRPGTYMKSECQQQKYIKEKVLDQYGISGNVNGLFTAGAYSIREHDIYYFNPVKLKNVKYIILSATANGEVYRLFNRKREIRTYDIPHAKYRGKLIQHTYNSMSRQNIDTLLEQYNDEKGFLKMIRSIVPMKSDVEPYFITFKQFARAFGTKYYFGNLEGIDQLKGRDGIILGTSHKDENCYKLAACYLGQNVTTKKAQLSRRYVEYNGWKFPLMTYEDEVLRVIQLYYIETDMEQAIGRSRLLRTDASVFLFSNFPCSQANIITNNYLKSPKESDASANASDRG